MKNLNTIGALKKFINENNESLFVRWSRGPAMDKKQGNSRDYLNGAVHNGLSSVEIKKEWTTDDEWLARRINEYVFLRMKDNLIGCWIYKGEKVGEDSDGYDLIDNVEPVAKITNKLVNILQDIKWSEK